MAYQTITSQPGMISGQVVPLRSWNTETFDCCDDMGSCLLGAFCPIILAMKLSMDMDESACVPCCVPGSLIALRTKLRTQEYIQGSIMNDCLMMCLCGPCILCQMTREVDILKGRVHRN